MPSELGSAGSRDPLRAIYEQEQARPRRSRLFTGAVSLLMLGAVALVCYYAYQMGLRAGAQGPAPLIKAEQQPYKVKPDEPGGMDVPNQDKLIYKEVASAGSDTGKKPAEKLMPPPEAPLPKPESAQAISPAEAAQPAQPAAVEPSPAASPAGEAAAAAPAETAPKDQPPKAAPPKQVAQGGGLEAPSTPAMSGSSSQPSAKQAAAPAQVPAPLAASATASAAAPAAASAPAAPPASASTSASSPAAVAPSASAPASETPPAAKPARTPVASVEKTAPPAAAPAHKGGAGGWHVQLGAVRTNEEAQHEWARLQGKYRDLLGSLTLNVQRVDLGGGKGVFFRIQGGPLGEREEANALCDKLKALQVGCLAVRP